MYNYARDASRCLAILSINNSRLFAEGSVIPPEHRLMLVNFHRECIGDAKKSPVGPSHYIKRIFFFFFFLPGEGRGDKVSLLSHIYPHKPLRKIGSDHVQSRGIPIAHCGYPVPETIKHV